MRLSASLLSGLCVFTLISVILQTDLMASITGINEWFKAKANPV